MRAFLALLAAIVLVALGFLLFTGGDDKPDVVVRNLPEFAATDARVSYTQDGIINGDDTHRAIRITISRNTRLLEVLQGYSGNVLQSNPLYNTEDAFSTFLYALYNAGFTRTRNTKNTNVLGACPLGNRFIYEVSNTGDSNVDQNIWSATCGGLGTFGGKRANIEMLFERQITGYNELTREVNLN